MKKVILIGGDLASLKSTIAQRLSTDLSCIFLSKDRIKEVLGDAIETHTREDNLRLSKATHKLMIQLAIEHIKILDCLILESNFKDHEMDELNEVFKENGIQTLSVFLTGDMRILYERFIARQKKRHAVHRSTGFMSYETFLSSKRNFSLKRYGLDAILWDTTHFNDDDYHNLLTLITNKLS